MAGEVKLPPPDLTPAPKQKWRRGLGNRAVPTTADAIAEELRRDRRVRAMKLRVHGISKRRIAAILGVNEETVTRDIKQAIEERSAEDRAELQALATQALEAVLEGHLKKARAGDKDSAMVVINAVREHAKINGYAEPERKELTGKNGGPLVVSLEDIDAALSAADRNAANAASEQGTTNRGLLS